jgi:pyruvate dehydrogenase E2 component (dihydrolipoamide acetyltransferase)
LATKEIKVPNIGDVTNVEVIEVLVSPGDKIKKDDSIVTLESDKASMEIPTPEAGVVESIRVSVGDRVSENSTILTLSTEEEQTTAEPKSTQQPATTTEIPTTKEQAPPAEKATTEKVLIPDIGDAKNVEVIEIFVKPGQHVSKEEALMTLEGEKATMEIPSPYSGKIEQVQLKVGDKVSKGDKILTMLTEAPTEKPIQAPSEKIVPAQETEAKPMPTISPSLEDELKRAIVHASPSVRQLAREFGVDLSRVNPTGPKGRILKEDVQAFVKNVLKEGVRIPEAGLLAVSKMPEIDFSKFGQIEKIPLNKIKKLTGANVHRSWVTIPHVTQFGQADITDMEEFREAQKAKVEKEGIKLTPLVFIMKAVVAALKAYPFFNASLDSEGEYLILKKYFNLGIAVDTPNGLVVPVVKDVDRKGMLELARELAAVSNKAREKGLSPADMSGSCFTISSLGGIGGTAFTPIINAPDVAILGVSKASILPVFNKNQFEPRLMLPLSLSYDHRVIDGADGARFLVYLAQCLSDLRTLLL